MHTIELLGDKTDLVLLHTALTDYIEKIYGNGDKYEMASCVGDLIEQVEYIKATWEEN